jgi:hypothetical protein
MVFSACFAFAMGLSFLIAHVDGPRDAWLAKAFEIEPSLRAAPTGCWPLYPPAGVGAGSMEENG